MKESFNKQVEDLEKDWANNERWNGVKREYSAKDVVRLRGSILPQYSLAEHGAKLLWERLKNMDYVHALGALTGGQAIQYVKAGLPAIYLSGWQVAAWLRTGAVCGLAERLGNLLPVTARASFFRETLQKPKKQFKIFKSRQANTTVKQTLLNCKIEIRQYFTDIFWIQI